MKIKLLLFALFLIVNCQFSIVNCFGQSAIDSVSFDVPTTFIQIDTAAGNIWQIGHPQKIVLNNAHSYTNLIITDTINNYPPNNRSSFIYKHNIQNYCVNEICFWQKIDSDTLMDYGIVDFSLDNGNNWHPLIDTPIFNSECFRFNWENYTPNLTLTDIKNDSISGISNRWYQSCFTWRWNVCVLKQQDTFNFPYEYDTLMLRFSFVSDSIDNPKEGWMIDDIVFYGSSGIDCPSGINDPSKPTPFTLSPNPTTSLLTLENPKGFAANTQISISDMLGRIVFQQHDLTNKLTNVNKMKINLAELNIPSGVLFVKVQNGAGVEVRKVVYQRE